MLLDDVCTQFVCVVYSHISSIKAHSFASAHTQPSRSGARVRCTIAYCVCRDGFDAKTQKRQWDRWRAYYRIRHSLILIMHNILTCTWNAVEDNIKYNMNKRLTRHNGHCLTKINVCIFSVPDEALCVCVWRKLSAERTSTHTHTRALAPRIRTLNAKKFTNNEHHSLDIRIVKRYVNILAKTMSPTANLSKHIHTLTHGAAKWEKGRQ